jgi:pimeloyl-ACP methyl ester carboxylesterase
MPLAGTVVRGSLRALVALPFVACGSPSPTNAANPSLRAQTSIGRRADSSRAQLTRDAFAVVEGASVQWIACSADAQAQGAECGQLSEPLDRRHPSGPRIDVYFERYTHTEPGPAESAILVNPGGPGFSTTQGPYPRELWLSLFAASLDVHDLLLIDDRGRGLSGAIDCEPLQHGTGTSLDEEVAQCATQLGAADTDYATGDIALDTDDVRAALRYAKVDYYGGSWGGVDATAYATRFGEHVRSLILDSPQGPRGLMPFETERHQAGATLDEIRLECDRSPTCSPDHPNPNDEFAALVGAVRSHPFSGTGYDLSGNLASVSFDESLLATIAINGTNAQDGSHGSTGELLAAGASLGQGDPVPLLRLGAEAGGGNLLFDSGPPVNFSWGAFYGTVCSDLGVPYSRAVPRAQRLVQLDRAISQLPCSTFAPFSADAVMSEVGGSNTRLCVSWEEPTRPRLVVPPGAVYPNVPTLVLAADIDPGAPVALVREEAALFPKATFVTISEAAHTPVLAQDPCADQIATTFLETLDAGDTSCSKTPSTVWPAVGRFPVLAKDARQAEPDSSGHNAIGAPERRVASVAVATAVDALKRAVMAGGGNGFGLRGGTFTTTVDATGAVTVVLADCLFARDVTVNGTVVWGADASFGADLSVAGAGTAGGTLHVGGAWEAHGAVGNFAVSGALGGETVAVLVPEA